MCKSSKMGLVGDQFERKSHRQDKRHVNQVEKESDEIGSDDEYT